MNGRRAFCGCGAQPDPGYRTCAYCRAWATWRKRVQRHPELRLAGQLQKFVHGYARHGNAARAVREAHLSDGSGARRKGWQLLQKPHVVKAIIAELRQRKAADARQRASDELAARRGIEAEHERLMRIALMALRELEESVKLSMRLDHETRRLLSGGSRALREGSQGGAQSAYARVMRQCSGEPAHRQPGRCCCGARATSASGASCDRCRERDRSAFPGWPRRAGAHQRVGHKPQVGGPFLASLTSGIGGNRK